MEPMKSYESARALKELSTELTGIPHFVKSLCYGAHSEDLPVEICDHYVVSCPLDKEYDDLTGSNEVWPQRCARAWNEYSEAKGSPTRYEARVSESRWFFSNIWKVFAK